MSKIKIALKYLTGGVDAVAEYALETLNAYIERMDGATKQSAMRAINLARQVLNTLNAFAWLVPQRWQTAYSITIKSVETVIAALSDEKLDLDEVQRIAEMTKTALVAWRSDDDETCVASTDADAATATEGAE